MATIKVKFRPSLVADVEGTVYYRIIHERKVKHLLTQYHILPSEWDVSQSKVLTSPLSERKSYTVSVRERIRRDVDRLTRIIRKFDITGEEYTVDDLVDEYNRYARDYTLLSFMDSVISSLRRDGKIRTSETYTATRNSFRNFLKEVRFRGQLCPGDDVMLDSINSELMKSYEAWQQRRGVTPNTISFYTRILRAVYNRAVEDGIIDDRRPFRHVYTGVEKTVKRALPIQIIKKIRTLDLAQTPALDYARDMFVMSFMLRGMSFVDMAFLRKSDLAHGYITYRRRKTGHQLMIEWTKDMQTILDKYPENKSDYLLPIIKNKRVNERCTYRNVGYNINHSLKTIAQKVRVNIPLTLYVARHSWASAARAKGVPLSVISEGMGHDSESTTQIYLASLENSTIDKANNLILKALR